MAHPKSTRSVRLLGQAASTFRQETSAAAGAVLKRSVLLRCLYALARSRLPADSARPPFGWASLYGGHTSPFPVAAIAESLAAWQDRYFAL